MSKSSDSAKPLRAWEGWCCSEENSLFLDADVGASTDDVGAAGDNAGAAVTSLVSFGFRSTLRDDECSSCCFCESDASTLAVAVLLRTGGTNRSMMEVL
jgi:hypothetical protein